MVGELGVGEIERTSDNGIGLHRSPDRIDQVGAGLDNDGSAARPGDVESELIRSRSEGGVAGLNLWQPGFRWNPAKIGTPTAGVRQVKDSQIGSHVKECAPGNPWRIPLEVDRSEVRILIERQAGEVGNAPGNG